ncbi:MAG: 50S ribosomal protein L35 [Micavibrio sp.]|nr:50S ribosomal protein L35 [Micavibrio sp.]
MPKMKTKSTAKKRFKVTGNGKVKYKNAFSRHMMMNKSRKMKRKAKGMSFMFASDAMRTLKNFLPYKRRKATLGNKQRIAVKKMKSNGGES